MIIELWSIFKHVKLEANLSFNAQEDHSHHMVLFDQNFNFLSRSGHQKNSHELRIYESVDDKNLS